MTIQKHFAVVYLVGDITYIILHFLKRLFSLTLKGLWVEHLTVWGLMNELSLRGR